MEFKWKEHPSIFLLLIAVIMLILSVVIAYLFQWRIYADVLIVIAGIACIVLGYGVYKDISLFKKKQKESEEKKNDKK